MEDERITWEEIKDFLQIELERTRHIMTWGTIGSLNIENDIDTIITKKPNSPSADFFKEIHNIFEKLDDYLFNKFNTKVIRFANSTQEYLVKGYTKDRKLMFHTMIYISFPQIEKDWGWALFKEQKISDMLKENYTCIQGNVKDLFTKDFQKESYFENAFIYLYSFDSLNSNLPKNVFLNTMNACFKCIYKKILNLENPLVKNREEVKKYFYELCNILDKKNKEKFKI